MVEIEIPRKLIPTMLQYECLGAIVESLREDPTFEKYKSIKKELDTKKRFYGESIDPFYMRLDFIKSICNIREENLKGRSC